MKQKKFLSGLMAAVLALGLCVPVSAAAQPGVVEGNKGQTTITIGSTVNLPTIKVTIGTATDVVLNPYKMNYNATSTDTLISTPVSIKSNSTIKMKIAATPTAKTDSADLEFATAGSLDGSKKAVYLCLAMAPVADSDGVSTFTGKDTSITGFDSAVVRKDGGATPPETATINLDAATDSQDTNAKYGAFKVIGESAGTGWDAVKDAVTISVVFDIEPVIS